MTTRQVTLRVICSLPEDTSVMELKAYIRDAIKTHTGNYPPYNFFLNKEFKKSIRILGKYKRRVS